MTEEILTVDLDNLTIVVSGVTHNLVIDVFDAPATATATATASAPPVSGGGGGVGGGKGRKKKRWAYEAGEPQRIRRLSELDPPLFTPEQVLEAKAIVIPPYMAAVFNDDDDAEFMVM